MKRAATAGKVIDDNDGFPVSRFRKRNINYFDSVIYYTSPGCSSHDVRPKIIP